MEVLPCCLPYFMLSFDNFSYMQKTDRISDPLVLALPIFPGRRQPSIVGRNELNYRVRNGNGWTLILISTNSLSIGFSSEEQTVL